MRVSEVGLWHVRPGGVPVRLTRQALPSEKDLESWIEGDPSLIAPGLHSVDRQVKLGPKILDLLAIEAPGVWVVCELKKVALEREVLAQAIDYVARIDELTRDELAAKAMSNVANQTPEVRELVQQALAREDNGEAREVRIVLAGVGVTQDLTRMVTYLSAKYEVPIRICTLSAVNSPVGDGLILIRDISEDTETELSASAQGSTYEDRMASVRKHFEKHGLLPMLDSTIAILDANPNFYMRPWKKALMVAPAANHARCLIYLTPRKSGVFVSPVIEAVEMFFPNADIAAIEALPADEIFTDVEDITKWASAFSAAIGFEEIPTGSTNSPNWNGTDWYVAFGEDETRSWEDAREYGFVSAGGGDWYSKTLRKVPEGARVFAYVPKSGYVGVGHVTGPAQAFAESSISGEARLRRNYQNANGEPEYVLPIAWVKTVPLQDALTGVGLFANQNSACKLRDPYTLKQCFDFFDVDEPGGIPGQSQAGATPVSG